MKVLGYCIFSAMEQRSLADGVLLTMAAKSLVTESEIDPRIGDLIWVKEPWALISSRRAGPQNIREAAVGPVIGRNRDLPPRVKAILNQLRQQPKPPYTLARADSRATLEITGLGEDTLQVRVHLMQVDQFRRKARAA